MSVRAAGRSAGSGFLSRPGNEELIQIHGVAIGSNDITRGHLTDEDKLWRPKVLEESAYTLEGQQIVVNHSNKDVDAVVGQVTDAAFEPGTGVIYQGVINDEDLAEKIGYGWIDVSPRIIHTEEYDEVEGVKAPQKILAFDNLSLVTRGAAASNEVDLGEHDELSAEELQQAFDNAPEIEGVVEEYQVGEDHENPFESKEDVADVYSEELQEKDIDANLLKWIFDSKEAAQGASQALGCSGFHELIIDDQEIYLPCDDRDTFLKNFVQADENMDDIPEPEEEESQTADGDSSVEAEEGDDNLGEKNMTEEEDSGFELSENARKLALVAEMEDAPISELSLISDDELAEKEETIEELTEENEELREDAERVEELEDRVEELEAERDEAEEEAEELSEAVESVKEPYAEALEIEGRVSAEELMDKFEFEELQEKYDEAVGEGTVEELAADQPDPQSGDPSAGRQSAEGDEPETVELSEEEEALVSEMSEAGGAWADIAEEVEEELSAAE